MEAADNPVTRQKEVRERQQSRERKAAFWILLLAMAFSAVIAMIVTMLIQRP